VGERVPLPASFGLHLDHGVTDYDDSTVLMGGSPLRLLRLSGRGRGLLQTWLAGAAVGDRPAAGRLARRLVAAGICHPDPPDDAACDPANGAADMAHDVTVVIPVRDRPAALERLLGSLSDVPCVVVDDGSVDPARTETVARAAGARIVVLNTNQGPSAARNAGLAEAATPLVAFVDSDCLPEEGWLGRLVGHFADPLVAAVAPRIVGADHSSDAGTNSSFARYARVRSSLDRGPAEGPVRPHSRIPFVPSATLIVRRTAAPLPFFDPSLRGGEDVDLVWRLTKAGWDVRYVPSVTVAHHEPRGTRAWLERQAFYGSTAGPLSQRHPDALAPLETSVWTAATWSLLLARRPLAALGVLGAATAVLARRLNSMIDQPARAAAQIAVGGTARAAPPALAGLTRAWSPALVVGLWSRRTRPMAAAALLLPAARSWRANSGGLDPLRFAAYHMADDLAYGVGVWKGCLQARTMRPLLPRIVFRSRTWKRPTLRADLHDET
jgi:mycofactocin system glycosyltransferase